MESDSREQQRLIDAALVDRANAGEHAAFEELYHRHRDWVASLAYRFTRDRELALDVAQETFLHLLRQFPGFELRAQLRTYLYPIVRHVSISLQSKAMRKPSIFDTAAATSDRLESETASELGQAIARLSPAQAEVLMLRFGDDLTLEEIAQALQIPLGTVKSRLHNALDALRRDAETKEFFLL